MTDKFDLAAKAIGIFLPFMTFALGKASKGGANQVVLDQACKDLADMRSTLTQQGITLASHTTLHTGYIATNARVESTLGEMNRQLGIILGQLQSRG